jgi:hypothetical protein
MRTKKTGEMMNVTSSADFDLEESVRRKFASFSTDRLIKRMESASDFGYDDEEIELTRRGKEKGFTWGWDQSSLSANKIIIKKVK